MYPLTKDYFLDPVSKILVFKTDFPHSAYFIFKEADLRALLLTWLQKITKRRLQCSLLVRDQGPVIFQDHLLELLLLLDPEQTSGACVRWDGGEREGRLRIEIILEMCQPVAAGQLRM